MLKELQKSKSLKAFLQTLKREPSFLLENFWDSSTAMLSHFLLKETKRDILLISSEKTKDSLIGDLLAVASDRVIEIPALDIQEGLSPSPDILGKRLENLFELSQKKENKIVSASLNAILQKTPTRRTIGSAFHRWKIKDRITSAPSLLSKLGYEKVDLVTDKGQFATRGSIFDVFPTCSFNPFRVEFFDDEIETIRSFDVASQTSIERVKEILISPANEKIFKEMASLLDYFKNPIVIFYDLVSLEDNAVILKDIAKGLFSFDSLLKEEYQKIYLLKESAEDISEITKENPLGFFQKISFEIFSQKIDTKRYLHPFLKVSDYLCPEGKEIFFDPLNYLKNIPQKADLIFLSENEREEKDIKDKIKKDAALPKSTFKRGDLSSGFAVLDIPLLLISYSDIAHKVKIRRQKWRTVYYTPYAEYHHLNPGDYVVHTYSGIGRYLGIERHKSHLGKEIEFLKIEYANKAKLFVPLSQSYLVSRYISSKEETPTLYELGSNKWQRIRQQTQKKISGYAADLLKMQAERELEGGFLFPADSKEMKFFELEFPYDETHDQQKAITAVKELMKSNKAMDLLVCGDVGYGKTEVAMRAAFKAAFDGGKQVALLVPTTVLAMQHYDTFRERMKNFPIVVEVISRFKSSKESKEIIEKTEKGEVDILIGTHKILSKDILFKDLGLIIIDEEQRFGVRAKEQLKRLKKGVDTMVLSATPIPRTLYLSLTKIKDMVSITTPPQDRLPVRIIVAKNEDNIIKDAISFELAREGQIFFIHNRIETIEKRASHIKSLFPKARIAISHGKISSEDADLIFHRFKQGKLDILVSTTIIENGIDIPNANTIIIDKAENFGLADLYQLQGRVGRWNRRAFAYFLTNKTISPIAKKRLKALLESGGFGAGMKIALRDLEIRGAGDILGIRQSGQISAIGLHLYCKLLKRTIDALKNHKKLFLDTRMEFDFPALIPENYIEAPHLRSEIYYRFGEASLQEELDNLMEEIKDRFGLPPIEVIWLYHLMKIRLAASFDQFTLLKFKDLTLTAEKQKGNKIIRKSITLPDSISPNTLSKITLSFLSSF